MPPRRRTGGGGGPEAVWQSTVIQLSTLYRWDYYHPPDVDPRDYARTPHRRGWPDLVLAKPSVGRVLFVELKAPGNYPSPDQRKWLAQLDAAGLEVGLWWPKDLDYARAVLGPEGRRLELPPRYRHQPIV